MNRCTKKTFKRYRFKPLALMLGMVLAVAVAQAQQAAATPAAQDGGMSAGGIMALATIGILALVIGLLGHAVIGARSIYEERAKREKEQGSGAKVMILLIITSLLGIAATAQTNVVATQVVSAAADAIGGMPPTMFYISMATIVIEVAVIIALVNLLKFLTGIQREKLAEVKAAGAPGALTIWWNKINKSVAIEKEKDIDLSHDYDGIRELDNSIPPWWSWAFVACFIFAIVYLWRYHVSETAPLQLQELQIAMQRAEAEKDAYLKTSAKKVDENTVTMMDAAGIAAGQATYKRNCVTCHGNNGEGNSVGPNLTDNYWLHKGGLSDIFKSVKYGWVEKGMQSWQGMLSATEIAEVSSYIKSISGTNYPNGKAPQGELYKDEAVPAASGDSAKAVTPKADTAVAPKK